MSAEHAPRVELSRSGDAIVLALLGDHDLSSAPLLRQELAELEGLPLVVLDLEHCTFLDSTVLGVLASAGRRFERAGAALVVRHAHGIVRNALRLTGMRLLDEDA